MSERWSGRSNSGPSWPAPPSISNVDSAPARTNASCNATLSEAGSNPIPVAVGDQERRGVCVHTRQRARGSGFFADRGQIVHAEQRSFERWFEQVTFEPTARTVGEQVGLTEPVHGDVDGTGLLRMVTDRAFEIAVTRSQRGQAGQHRTGRGTPDSDAIGGQAVGGAVGPQPTHRCFGVMDLSREQSLADESVVGRGDRDPPFGQGGQPLLGAVCLVTDLPASAVQVQHDRNRLRLRGRAVDVESQADIVDSGELQVGRDTNGCHCEPFTRARDTRCSVSWPVMRRGRSR